MIYIFLTVLGADPPWSGSLSGDLSIAGICGGGCEFLWLPELLLLFLKVTFVFHSFYNYILSTYFVLDPGDTV